MAQQLPSELLASLQTVKGFDELAFIAAHKAEQQVVSVRVNRTKCTSKELGYNENFIVADNVPWSSGGYYLERRPSFTLDPLFHAGAYYVQEASSMFLEEAIRQCCDLTQSLRVLDLCAAPGGKSTLIQSILPASALLVSNEVIKTRANILVENIIKWGAANVVVTNNDPKDFRKLPGFFDLIVVDAPCSGSGLFRKDEGAIDEWSINNVLLCKERQQRILSDVMDSLSPGGKLIYSTCSYSLEEDEELCDWLLENHPLETVPLSIKKDWGIVETLAEKSGATGYRFYPDKVKGEGFFIAVFKKSGESFPQKGSKSKQKMQLLGKEELETAQLYIQNPEKYTFIKWNDEVLAIPGSSYEDFLQLQNTLYIKKAGVKIGKIIRNELVPDHELVLSSICSGRMPAVNVDEATALDFLRKKDIKINTDTIGWATINYRDLPLGLVKILPNRINNYYPREWRILNK